MLSHTDQIRLALAGGPVGTQALRNKLEISQPTLTRNIATMGEEIVRIRSGRSIGYAIQDAHRGFGVIPVYRVGFDGKIKRLGELIPVRSEGFVMLQEDGQTLYSEGIPWWLLDMRPQGFMGRAYASAHAIALGLPTSINEWSDSHALRALLAHGHDAVGNILLGDITRERFLNATAPVPVALQDKGAKYQQLSRCVASTGDTWSSAAGEQPKFATYAQTTHGDSHVIVKFTLPDANPVTQRWRDLLLCEHHALQTLGAAGVDAARSAIIDYEGQRFLEVERFDRVGAFGRVGLFSLAALDAEFTGMARQSWPVVAKSIAEMGHITEAAFDGTVLLYAFGMLIGNTDMHHGNLSFVSSHGRPYSLAPAYDMLPMGFQPRLGGLTRELNPVTLHAAVPPRTWVQALHLANSFMARIRADERFSLDFAECIDGLAAHIVDATGKIERLAQDDSSDFPEILQERLRP